MWRSVARAESAKMKEQKTKSKMFVRNRFDAKMGRANFRLETIGRAANFSGGTIERDEKLSTGEASLTASPRSASTVRPKGESHRDSSSEATLSMKEAKKIPGTFLFRQTLKPSRLDRTRLLKVLLVLNSFQYFLGLTSLYNWFLYIFILTF